MSKYSVCWDPLQALGIQDNRSQSVLYYGVGSLWAMQSAAGTEGSHSFPNPATMRNREQTTGPTTYSRVFIGGIQIQEEIGVRIPLFAFE